MSVCDNCNGSGKRYIKLYGGEPIICGVCHGSGVIDSKPESEHFKIIRLCQEIKTDIQEIRQEIELLKSPGNAPPINLDKKKQWNPKSLCDTCIQNDCSRRLFAGSKTKMWDCIDFSEKKEV